MSALLVAVGLTLASCDRSAAPAKSPTAGAPSPAIKQTRHTSTGDAVLDIDLTLDRGEMTVAQRLTATLLITTRAEATISLPPAAPTLGDFNIVSAESHESVQGAKRQVIQHLVLEPFLAGDKSLPAIEVRAADGTRKLALKTEPITIKVSSIAGTDANDQTPLAPARAPVALLSPSARQTDRIVWFACGGILLITLATTGLVGLQRRRTRIANLPINRITRALNQVSTTLAAPDSRDSAANGAAKLHDALATFLHDQFALPATTSTAAEIDHVLSVSDIPQPDRQSLAMLLADLERARFGPGGAAGSVIRQLLERASVWVQSVSHLQPSAAKGDANQ